MMSAALQLARVVASRGRQCLIETPAGERIACQMRGRKLDAIVGDAVRWRAVAGGGVIEAVEPRRTLLHRQDDVRQRLFAANIDQALIVLAAEPAPSLEQLARALIACEAAHIPALIALNKADLAAPFAQARARLAPLAAAGCRVLALCADAKRHAPPDTAPDDALLPHLRARATLLLGPSGAGKSTLINRLIPGAAALTGEISQALRAGRHTTTASTWYWLDEGKTGALIDSPGFQQFGLRHIARAQLAACMPDIAAHTGGCRFYNCTHRAEPGCSVSAAVQRGALDAARWQLYCQLYDECRAGAESR